MTYHYDKQFLDDVDFFLAEGGYENLTEWMRDSDYLLVEDGYWVDLDDNPVEPLEQINAAMESANAWGDHRYNDAFCAKCGGSCEMPR